MTKILITDRFDLSAQIQLQNIIDVTVKTSATPRPSSEELADTEILIIRSKTRIDKDLIQKAPKLKLIVTCTSGFDHIDFESCHNIKLAYTPEANTVSAAELTWNLVLACARQTVDANMAVRNGTWNTNLNEGFELHGKTYGIIGLGRIGQKVAAYAKAFGMDVMAFDPYADDQNFNCAKRKSMEEVFKLADVISFHVPLTKETYRMVNASTLEFLHRGVVLINTSRGAILDEIDVVQALQKGWIKALGLDVFAKEPLAKDSQLHRCANVTFSPHIGARTEQAFQKASLDAVKAVKSFLTNGDLAHPLPPDEPWYTSPKGFN